MQSFLPGLAVTLTSLALVAPAHADDHGGIRRLLRHLGQRLQYRQFSPHGFPQWSVQPLPSKYRHDAQYFQPRPAFSEGDLERHIERTITGHFGYAVDDVDVDVDNRRGRIEIEAEVRHPEIRAHLEQLLYSMPELAGYRLELDIEVDD